MKYDLLKKRIKEKNDKLIELAQTPRDYEQAIEGLSTSIKLYEYIRRYLYKCKEANVTLQDAEEILSIYMEEKDE